jgi:hypothetical protein
MNIEETGATQESATEKFVGQISASVDKLAINNIGTSFVVVAISKQGLMVTVSTNNLPDPLTRICLLIEAARNEATRLQQALHKAAQAETVRLVQQSTEAMTKN